MARKIRLWSPLAPVPLARILEAEMDREWSQAEKNRGRVFGQGTEQQMSLRVVHWSQRNSFAAQLRATMVPERGGTLIAGRIGTPSGTGCFMAIWLGGVAAFFLMSTFIWPSSDVPLTFKLMFSGIPAVMFLFGLGILFFGRKSTPDDERRILDFLAQHVQAREQPVNPRR